MSRILSTIFFILSLKFFVFAQKNEAFSSNDIKNTRWSYKRYLSEIKIGDTIEFKKSSYQRWEMKFKSSGSIIEAATFTDYTGKRFIRKKYKAGVWKLENQVLVIKESKGIYNLKLISKDKNAIKLILTSNSSNTSYEKHPQFTFSISTFFL
jgi:hypothetical protein